MNENYKNDENLSTRYTIWFMKRKIDIEYAYCLIVTKRKKKFSWAARNNVYNDGEISVGLNEVFLSTGFLQTEQRLATTSMWRMEYFSSWEMRNKINDAWSCYFSGGRGGACFGLFMSLLKFCTRSILFRW